MSSRVSMQMSCKYQIKNFKTDLNPGKPNAPKSSETKLKPPTHISCSKRQKYNSKTVYIAQASLKSTKDDGAFGEKGPIDVLHFNGNAMPCMTWGMESLILVMYQLS